MKFAYWSIAEGIRMGKNSVFDLVVNVFHLLYDLTDFHSGVSVSSQILRIF